LDPQKMIPLGQGVSDISRLSLPTYHVSNQKGVIEGLPKLLFPYYWTGPDDGRRVVRFPEGTEGLLYYRHLREGPPTAGEMRFRICNSPADFESGRDLMGRDGKLPWSIPLFSLAVLERYRGVVHLLRQDGLVDTDLISDLARLPAIPRAVRIILHEVGQPFEADLGSSQISIVILHRHGWQMFELRNLFKDHRDNVRRKPYTGRAIVRLVVSPRPEHADNPALLIQFVELLSPVECVIPGYDYHVAQPVPGGYYSSKDKKGVYRPWAYLLKPKWNAENIRRILGI